MHREPLILQRLGTGGSDRCDDHAAVNSLTQPLFHTQQLCRLQDVAHLVGTGKQQPVHRPGRDFPQ